MAEFITIAQIDAATDAVRARIHTQPKSPSSLAPVWVSWLIRLRTHNHPHPRDPPLAGFHRPGHKGRLIIGQLEGKEVLVLQGRTHYYEGHSISQIGLPIRVMQRLGIKPLILTNASGGLKDDFQPGDLMLIKDHLALLPMAGENPLRGPNLDEFGPRFPT